jgi:thioredoxin 1
MSDFNEIINSDKPTLVDFFATWCGPCKVMNPVIEDTKSKLGEEAKVLKVDVDNNREAAMKYGVRGVPTFIIFKNGEPVWKQSGVISSDVLVQKVREFA